MHEIMWYWINIDSKYQFNVSAVFECIIVILTVLEITPFIAAPAIRNSHYVI